MLVLVCGDRHWDDKEAIKRRLGKLPPGSIVMHGACEGADTLAGEAAYELGFVVRKYPAEWEKYGKAAGPKRNLKMLDERPDLVLAFHKNLDLSKGTKHTVYTAMKRKMNVEVLP